MEGFCWGAPFKTQYLSFSPVVKAIQLVEKLQHSPLNLPLSATVTLIPGQYFHTRSHGEDLHEISHSLAEHLCHVHCIVRTCFFNEPYIPFGANGVNFVNEDNTWAVFVSHSEQLAHLKVVR